jgi:hypothetical protein
LTAQPKRVIVMLGGAIALTLSSPLTAGSGEQSGVTFQGHLSHNPCDAKKYPGCPDYSSYRTFNEPWEPGPTGYLGLMDVRQEYATMLGRNVDVFWFKPSYSEQDDSKLRSQAFALLERLQTTARLHTDLAVARTYWYDGTHMKIDSYIFHKVSSDRWQRNRDGALVDKIIQSHL